MIRVTIEMVPGGVGKPYVMHVIEIWNRVGTTVLTPNFGDYGYRISRKFLPTTTEPSWHRSGEIERFPRAAKNAVHLLLACLQKEYNDHQPIHDDPGPVRKRRTYQVS